jgi:tellurite methyltransferase
MIRLIDDFHQDDAGDWVAELSCLHNQHVRHRPPFWDRPWVESEVGRRSKIGTAIDCPLCDRAELPLGLERARTAGPFDRDTLPPALFRAHCLADRTWGVLRVLEGVATLTFADGEPRAVRVEAGDQHAIAPGVVHRVSADEPMRVAIDFLVRPDRLRHSPQASPALP